MELRLNLVLTFADDARWQMTERASAPWENQAQTKDLNLSQREDITQHSRIRIKSSFNMTALKRL